MRKSLIAVGLFCVSSLAFAEAPASEGLSSADWSHVKPKVEIQVKRARAADTYLVTASITDLRSGRLLAKPQLTARVGTPARIEVGARGAPGLVSVDATITLDPTGATAVYSGDIRDNDEVISSQVVTIAVSS